MFWTIHENQQPRILEQPVTQVGIECVTWKLTSWRSESRLIHTRSRLLQSAGRSHTPGQWSPGKSETGRLYWPITKRRPGLEMKRGVPKTGEVVYYKFHVYIINKERIISRNFLAYESQFDMSSGNVFSLIDLLQYLCLDTFSYYFWADESLITR